MILEQAQTMALRMPRLQGLVNVRRDIDCWWQRIDIIRGDGLKVGIGNAEAKDEIKKALINILNRQIEEAAKEVK